MIKTEIYKLDRIEEDIAVVENPEGVFLSFSAKIFPENAKSGDCFKFENGVFVPIAEESEKRRGRISDLLSQIISEK